MKHNLTSETARISLKSWPSVFFVVKHVLLVESPTASGHGRSRIRLKIPFFIPVIIEKTRQEETDAMWAIDFWIEKGVDVED
jgi:hypothetical protein